MTKDEQWTPASDPARLCAVATNMDIARGIARTQSKGGRTVLIWTDEVVKSGRPGNLIPRYQVGNDEAPGDLKIVLAGYTDGVVLPPRSIYEWNRRLKWTESKKNRERYKSVPDTPSARKKPGEP